MKCAVYKWVCWGMVPLTLLTLSLLLVYKQAQKDTLESEKPAFEPVFSESYPVHTRFLREVSQLREKRLTFTEENLIHNFVFTARSNLAVPSSLLWCLLFQESRLDKLSGVENGSLTTGLGQFSNSAFFEVNYHLSRYLKSPKTMVTQILGTDVRPIAPDSLNLNALHSYYHIPTAVTATALFLHNRRVQLIRAATQHQLSFSPELLWAWAALSYNKGGRTVIALWKEIEDKFGAQELSNALSTRESFVRHTQNLRLISRATQSIWKDHRSQTFSEEWLRHSTNLTDCSFIKPKQVEGGS